MAFLRRLLGRKPRRRVVLVTPPSYFTETVMRMPTYPFSLVPVVSMTPFIPLGPAYLAASLREAGFDPRVVDLTFFDKRKVDVEQVRDVSWDRYDETDADDPLYLPEGMTQEQLKECVDRANEYLLKPSM